MALKEYKKNEGKFFKNVLIIKLGLKVLCCTPYLLYFYSTSSLEIYKSLGNENKRKTVKRLVVKIF